ncbi:MAG TPA: hypothetical protein VGW38_10760, partial [Chloroflexota bacterium]|nr:hypothetical protein [Chloroflexota bacterium]
LAWHVLLVSGAGVIVRLLQAQKPVGQVGQRTTTDDERPTTEVGGPTTEVTKASVAYSSLRTDAVAVLGLVLLATVQLWPVAGPGRLPENLDLMLQYVPNAAYLAHSLAEWRVPLWNPYLGTGMPFAADPGAGAWYVVAWPLLRLFSLYDAVRALLWLHLFWATLGTYVFARAALGLGSVAAWVAAASFALTTWLPGLTGMPVVLTAVSWLPWILLLGIFAASHGGRWVGLLALAGALQAVSGWPAGAYLSWLALGLLVLLRTPGWWPLTRVAGAAGVAVMLAGVLLIPAAEFIMQTSYAETRPLSQIAQDGYLTLLSWLRPAGGFGSRESGQYYLGVVAVVLALVGLMYGRQMTDDRRRKLFPRGLSDAHALTVIALLALLTAAGTRLPLFPALYQWLPGFRIVFLPARVGIVAAFALACLAALGMQRLRDGRLERRQSAFVGAAALGLLPVLLLQFWHSEGYDNFRRLLTNLGRFSGGPFLTREQEAHYLFFGSTALLATTLLARSRRRWLPPLFLGLLTVDLVAVQWAARPSSFDPAAWYAPAYQTAAAIQQDLGAERIAGMQWHGSRHFLADFPMSANPALLPPNLALLTGVRDAQGYNPLLLRRAAEYFAQINYLERGTLEPDDHWLWLQRFGSELVDQLAVRSVLTAGAEWRVKSTRILGPQTLRPGDAPVRNSLAPLSRPLSATRLHVVTFLGEGTHLLQGTPVALIAVASEDGTVMSYVLRAGEHTAEWAYGRSDVQATVQHAQAPVALETRLVDAIGGRFSVYEYLATFDLVSTPGLAYIELLPLLPSGSTTTLHVGGAWIEPPGEFERAASQVTSVLHNSSARPRLSTSAGHARILVDEPERIIARVTGTSSSTVVLADVYYPGWVARIDGQPISIHPTEGLFRSVAVPAGEHVVSFSYEPRSLWPGLALSAIGGALAALFLVPWRRPMVHRRRP